MWLVDDIVEEVCALARPESRIEVSHEGGRVKINVRKDLVTMQMDLSPEESLKFAIAIATHAKKAQGEEHV